ncbi:MAG: type IV secretion system DNA-binding domain-containing protein [Deltaproteobacteria bacterium]|nr:type IV secretion system DNA-binding domain-containing protein [Deltaproteobacteria bacterium]
MFNYQSFRIHWAKVEHSIGFILGIAIILHVILALPVSLVLCNWTISLSIFTHMFGGYKILWVHVFKALQYKEAVIYSFLIYPIFIPIGIFITLKINSNSAAVKSVGENNKNDKYISGARFGNLDKYNKTIKPEEIICSVGPAAMTIKSMFRNLLIWATTGAGKSQIALKFLSYIYNKFPSINMVIYDPAPEYTNILYNPKNGDIIFNPADARSCVWNILNEINNKSDIELVAKVIIPEESVGDKNSYFTDNARLILEAILNYLLVHREEGIATNENLIKYCAMTPAELLKIFDEDNLIRNESVLAMSALKTVDETVGAIMSELTRRIKPFSALPSKPDIKGVKSFNITTDFLEKKGVRIFINSHKEVQDYVRPILTLFIELLFKKFLSAPDFQNPHTIFHLEEFASLNRMSSITDLVNEGRKKNALVVITIQDRSKVDSKYGKELTESIISGCNNQIYGRVGSSVEATYVSNQIGMQEVERTTSTDSVDKDGKYTHSESTQIIEKYLLLPSTIKSLKDLEFIIQIVNVPTFFHFNISWVKYKEVAEGFIESHRLKIRVGQKIKEDATLPKKPQDITKPEDKEIKKGAEENTDNNNKRNIKGI